MKLIKYTEDHFYDWDEFVKNSRNSTFMNTRRFLSYHTKKFNDYSLMFYKKNNLLAVFPACIKEDVLTSHSGMTYGGIIISNDCKVKDVSEIVKQIISKSKSKGLKKIIIKTAPRIYHKYPSDEVDYILHYNGFTITKRELSSVILLDKLDKSFMLKNTIVANKQAIKKGIRVVCSDDYCGFWRILEENLIIHEAKPTHTIEEIKILSYLFPDNIKLFLAFNNRNIIGGSVVFIKGDTVHTQYTAMDYDYEKYRPLNAVIAYLIEYYKHKKYLSFGVSTPNGEYVNWGLARFKEGFGGRGIVRETWTKELL